MKSKRLLLCLLLALLAPAANAVEPGIPNYPLGGPGALQNDLPPIPGVFALYKTSYASADGLYDDKGKKQDIPGFDSHLVSHALSLLVSYPGDVLGAHAYSQIILPYLRAGQTTTLPFATITESKASLGSVTLSPLLLVWDRPNFQKVQLGLDIATDAGSYDKTAARAGGINVSTGYTSYMPLLGWRYDKPDGAVASVLGRAIINTRNATTDYRSGTALVADFYLGWNLGPWQLGVVGSDAKQIEKDAMGSASPWPLQGKYSNVTAGPSVAYKFGPGIVNVNYQRAWHTTNGPNVSSVWVNLAFPLYAMLPPRP